MARYVLKNTLQEGKKAVWSVAFNFACKEHKDTFVAISANRATVYKCEPGGGITLLQAYVDINREEEFYTVKWTTKLTDASKAESLLLLGGNGSVLRVINVSSGALEWSAPGHGAPINDVAAHPLRPHIAITASRDQSLRVWNIASKCCVAVIGGEGGHRNEILSVAFSDLDCNRFASAGMDNAVKIWDLADIESTIDQSATWNNAAKAFPTAFLTSPEFSTQTVHTGYVDCVRWLGDFIMSKSTDSLILVWQPLLDKHNASAAGNGRPHFSSTGHIHTIQDYVLDDQHNIWFVRFSLDYNCRFVACGGGTGRINVFDCDVLTKEPKFVIKPVAGSESTVRQTALSYDASILLAAYDDGTVRRYDLLNHNGKTAAQSAATAGA